MRTRKKSATARKAVATELVTFTPLSRVKFSKGITTSKDFQSVRYDIGVEVDVDLGPNNERLPEEVAKLEEKVNAELRKRLNKGDFYRLG